jgi:hypothetical protein
MKSTLRPFLKTTLLILPLTLFFSGPAIAQARDRSMLSLGPIRPGHLDYRTQLPEGFLIVYSATDQSNDGGVPYYAHSYAIYTTDGKLFKMVQNHVSSNDESPEIVTLPIGSYVVEARSEKDGYVRVPATTKEGRRTILDLDLWERKTRFAQVASSRD